MGEFTETDVNRRQRVNKADRRPAWAASYRIFLSSKLLEKRTPRFYSGAVSKTRIPDDVMVWFRKTGAQGGKSRAKKYSKEQLSAWGKLGGRPRKKDKGK